MRYQNPRSVVAATRRTISRDALRARGAEFDLFLRREISEMAHLCAQIPQPSQLFHDIAPDRQRPASIATIGACLTALALDPTLPAHRFSLFEMRLHAYLSQPLPTAQVSCLRTLYDRETTAQAAADISGVRALLAMEHDDIGAIDAAIAHHAKHLEELKALLGQLEEERRQMAVRRLAKKLPNRVTLISAGVAQ